jgi:hypothetical protein
MFIEGHSFREMSRIAFSSYNELISPKSFERHMKKHLQVYISERRRIEARNLKFYFEKARDICKNILNICNTMIGKKLKKGISNDEDSRLLLHWIENKRIFTLLLYQLERLTDSKSSRDQNLENQILKCASEVFPSEVCNLFLQRWYNYDQKNVQVSHEH